MNTLMYDSAGKIYKTAFDTLPFVKSIPEIPGSNPPSPTIYIDPNGKDGNIENALSALNQYLITKDINVLKQSENMLFTLSAACEVLRHWRANKQTTYQIIVNPGLYDYTDYVGKNGTSFYIGHPDAIGNNKLQIRNDQYAKYKLNSPDDIGKPDLSYDAVFFVDAETLFDRHRWDTNVNDYSVLFACQGNI